MQQKPSPEFAPWARWRRVAVGLLLGLLLLQQLWTSFLTTGSFSGDRSFEKNSNANNTTETVNTTKTLVVEGIIAPTFVPTSVPTSLPTSVPTSTPLPLSLYSNLSCPFEWSKYSCFYQGRIQQAQSSYEHASLHLSNRTPMNLLGASYKLPKNILLVGDSTMRQVFVALGCGLLPLLSDHFADWAKQTRPWPCHGNFNCVKAGEHSGFNVAWMALKPNTQVWFVPHGGSRQHKQPNIIQGFQKELASNKSISFRLTPHHDKVVLGQDDVVVYNAGLHVKDRTSLYQELQGLGQDLLSLRQHHSLPRWVYLTTVTQHFATSDGQFVQKGQQSKVCRPSVASNPRLVSELLQLKEKVHVDRIVTVDDLELGRLHVGAYDGIDCTHYCMPGVPDVTAQRLLEVLHTLTSEPSSS